jgi:TonB-dependent starch-binding outer membrane protein SusC
MRKSILLCICLLFVGICAIAQTRNISGKVTDETNTPLPGVNITVLNSNTGTVTDANGNYKISAPVNSMLVFSFIGFQNVERTVTNDGEINVTLRKGENALSEVVVTGYTSQLRRQTSGSVVRVKADEVRLQPVASFEQQLQGKASGVLIESASGQPGSAASITIRGKTSVLGSTEPLYIVDGIQITAADFQSMNPSDFESFNILKDAMATAQYGSRGANGVIVITTRRGTGGKTKLTYDYQHGIGRLPENTIKLMNAAEKIAFEKDANGIYGPNPFGWTQQEMDSLSKVNVSYEDLFFRKNITDQHQISLSGGNERTRFFVSGSIFKQQGVVISTGLDRYSGRMNLDHTAGDFKLSLNTFFGSSILNNTSEGNTGIGSPLNAVRWHLPYVVPYLPDGSYNDADMNLQGQPNPFQELLENPRSNKQLKGVGSASIEYAAPFLKGLSAKTNWGVDFTDNTNRRYISRTTYLGSQQNGSQGAFSESLNRNVRYTGTTSLTYRNQGENQGFDISLFNEYIHRNFNSFGYTGYGLVGPLKNGAGITPGTPSNGFIPGVASNESQLNILSYFAIANYNYRGKYFLNGTVRRDGNSKLAEGKKWTTFGGIGASWAINSEEFMAHSRVFNDLKLRASYGSAGNSGVGDDYEALEQFGPISYNGVGGLQLVNFKKPQLTWERRTTANVGIDFGIFQNRVSGTIEGYNAITTNLYLNRQLSGTNGAYSILTNLGKLRNRGVEATINAAIFRGKGFNWSISANHTYNKSKILQLDGQNENIDGLFINRIGEAQNSIYVVRFAGVDPQTGNSIYLDKSGKETQTYDPNDRVIVGTIDPPHFGGVTNTFSYKGLELMVLFNYVFGNKLYNNDRTNVENPGYYYSSFSRDALRAWKQPGDITDFPSLLEDYHPETTRYVEDAKYFRLRNIMLSYSLPTSVVSHIKSSGIRVFVQGENLKTWYKMHGYGPEGQGNYLGSVYPPLKTITFGATIGF